MIRALLLLWFASQTISPEAAQHMQAGIAADKQKQFDVAITEFEKLPNLSRPLRTDSSASARLTWRSMISLPRLRR